MARSPGDLLCCLAPCMLVRAAECDPVWVCDVCWRVGLLMQAYGIVWKAIDKKTRFSARAVSWLPGTLSGSPETEWRV